MGLFGKNKINDPYNTMGGGGKARPKKPEQKAEKEMYKTCPDCQGYCLQRGGFDWFPKQGTPCGTCGGSGSVRA
jgi:hypothetical protein